MSNQVSTAQSSALQEAANDERRALALKLEEAAEAASTFINCLASIKRSALRIENLEYEAGLGCDSALECEGFFDLETVWLPAMAAAYKSAQRAG